jgi:uncharacterized protein (TIGR03435 family)
MIRSAVWGRRLWIGGAGWIVVAAAVLLGLGSMPLVGQAAQDTAAGPEPSKMMAVNAHPEFEVATIKPSDPNNDGVDFRNEGRHVSTHNTTVIALISYAYGVHGKQIAGGPEWVSTSKYDTDGVPDVAGEPNMKQTQEMYQKLLADRFKLTFHHEKRELPVYALTVGKSGPKLTKSQGDPNGLPDQNFTQFSANLIELSVSNSTIADFLLAMQYVLDRPLVDRTGLAGRYDFLLKWTPDESQFGAMGIRFSPPSNNPNGPPGLFTAIQEQDGLKLEAVKAQADVIVIDKVERPSAN